MNSAAVCRSWLVSFCLVAPLLAAETGPVDPARDTVSPVYAQATFPYTWAEVAAGEFTLMPVHWQRSNQPMLPAGMNCRPVRLEDGTVRVYFGKRGPGGGICYFDVDPAEPAKLKGPVVGPIITTGSAGTFDEDWVLCPEPVQVTPTHLRIYYAAKKKGAFFDKVWSLGVADSTDSGKSWTKYPGNPIMTATDDAWESGAVGFTSVERHGDGWRMWYLGTNTESNALKQVGYATSKDGYAWQRYDHNPVLPVDPTNHWEKQGIAVARMIRDGRLLRTWYACYPQNDTYAIGCAESVDGLSWTRSPHNPVLKGSGQGWDSRMTAYPGTIRVGDRYLMWYSGDGYGSKGVGLATADVPRGTWFHRRGETDRPDAAWTAWEKLDANRPPAAKYIQFAVVADAKQGE